MARDRDGAELERLLADRGSSLLAAATALAGSRQDGEDLLQAALERVLRKPSRQVQAGDVEGYLRRVLYNPAADGWRRGGTWKQKLLPVLLAESVTAAFPNPTDEAILVSQGEAGSGRRASCRLRQAVDRAPARKKTKAETETAALLGCSEGTGPSSAASRGLAHLRDLAAPDDATDATELTEKNS